MLTRWSFDPLSLIVLAAMLAGYCVVTGPLRRQRELGEPVSRQRVTLFVSGWIVLALAMTSPIDQLGRYDSFAVHTFQLLIITTVAAPLLLLAMPEWLMWLILPRRSLRNATRGFSFTVAAVVGFNGIVLFWHVGPLFIAASRSTLVHDISLLCFLVAGILTWWPLVTPLDRHTRMANPLQVLYLMMESIPLDVFGITALFIQHVFYPVYQNGQHLGGMSLLVDQQIGGAMLAIPGNLLDVVLMSIVFFIWIERTERDQQKREREEAEREEAEREAAVAFLDGGAPSAGDALA